jgi:hypothetical protein
MTQNYEMIFNRGTSLNNISNQSQKLKEESKSFKKDATKLKYSFWLRGYAMYIVIAGLILFILFMRFYMFA